MLENIMLLALAAISVVLLLRPSVRNSRSWLATVTPLASIIGSGFLVVAPLLANTVGNDALIAMVAIVLLAYAIGGVLRFNILYVETLLQRAEVTYHRLVQIERLSDLTLALAYFISITFYLRLLAAFVLRAVDIENALAANLITTLLVAFIGITGWVRGLNGLERMEEYAVSVKLAIIVSLLVGLSLHDIQSFLQAPLTIADTQIEDGWHTLRLLAGTLLIVQGFETSRYLGDEYDAKTRFKTMRMAQIISGLIYIVFIATALPLFTDLAGIHDETAIVTILAKVATILPVMLIVAASMSQFSAAIADMIGAGGLIREISHQRISTHISYTGIAIVAIILVWSANIFEIITLASRAFALYYFIQCLSAIYAVNCIQAIRWRWRYRIYFLAVATILLFVVLFAIPAE